MPISEYFATKYCPRCDKRYTAKGLTSEIAASAAMVSVKAHVSRNHPEHDPEWDDDTE